MARPFAGGLWVKTPGGARLFRYESRRNTLSAVRTAAQAGELESEEPPAPDEPFPHRHETDEFRAQFGLAPVG